VEGAVQALRALNLHSILVGPVAQIRDVLKGLGVDEGAFEIIDAPETITMEDSPTRAVVRKPNASMCVAYRLVEDGFASSVISTGNSGAMMAAGIMLSGLMPGIKRPAIATLIPSTGDQHPNVILDSGANVDCHAHNLIQFAVMGAIYCSNLFGVEKPRVALLSNGSEPSKGTDIIRAAAATLAQRASTMPESFSYVGYVEGRDVGSSKADVVVCDGFVGNVLLKAMEGCVKLIFDQLMLDSKKSLSRKLGLGLLKGAYHEVFAERFDYSAYGGAPLLGLRRIALVLHGASNSRAVKNAVRVAHNFSKARMNDKIALELSRLEDISLTPLDDIYPGMRNPVDG
jgi:glycerol-3-phosphate acyltransferase PlsX